MIKDGNFFYPVNNRQTGDYIFEQVNSIHYLETFQGIRKINHVKIRTEDFNFHNRFADKGPYQPNEQRHQNTKYAEDELLI
jgi:hypothetical protein